MHANTPGAVDIAQTRWVSDLVSKAIFSPVV